MNGNGKEYALAMFGIALEKENLEVMQEDMQMLKEVLGENPGYLEYLVNPAVKKSERLENIKEVFEDKVCEDVYSFLCILCEHEDTYCINEAINEFSNMYENYMHFATAVVTSAVELTEEEKAKLISKLTKVTGKRIVASYEIDKNLMGGITVEVDGMFYDGSVRKNLKNIKEVIS
ncbi:MAG: ATP synthase F1 subunit delta [Saccharofermentans sp.]|nr:ATP synthase F1 subunit delta [Saccharofermentans sp.]